MLKLALLFAAGCNQVLDDIIAVEFTIRAVCRGGL